MFQIIYDKPGNQILYMKPDYSALFNISCYIFLKGKIKAILFLSYTIWNIALFKEKTFL
jgi:hypothetical protein